MLTSVVIALEARHDAPAPRYTGRGVHAFFLRLIREADGERAARLHDNDEAKPFTVSSLMRQRGTRARADISSGEICFLRFTSYESTLSALLIDSVLPHLPSEVDLDGLLFAVKEAVCEPGAHPLVARSSYEHLASQKLLNEMAGQRPLQLFFASPTAFRSKGRNVPLPMPSLVFGSLVERWNAFSSVTVPGEVKRYAEECLAIGQCDISTKLVEIAGGKQVGFVGRCSYVAINRDPYWWRLVNLLADFAFFSGVGAKTTMGMGQTRRTGVLGLPNSTARSEKL